MITVRAMQVKDAEQVSELERMIFSQPWSYQGFVDSLRGREPLSRQNRARSPLFE